MGGPIRRPTGLGQTFERSKLELPHGSQHSTSGPRPIKPAGQTRRMASLPSPYYHPLKEVMANPVTFQSITSLTSLHLSSGNSEIPDVFERSGVGGYSVRSRSHTHGGNPAPRVITIQRASTAPTTATQSLASGQNSNAQELGSYADITCMNPDQLGRGQYMVPVSSPPNSTKQSITDDEDSFHEGSLEFLQGGYEEDIFDIE